MPWFWSSSNGDDDPVKKLDPKLRKYLENEAPDKYVPASSSPPVVEEKPAPAGPTLPQEDDSAPSVPSKSLYPDGRYAHLWKTYKPPVEETGPGIGTQKVIEERRERGALVKRAVYENCAMENEILTMCYKKPDTWTQTLTQCDKENRTFNRCWATQGKFLNALGYATSEVWDTEKEEQIQLHADKLYHEMLDYEKKVEEAREADRPPPPLTSLFNPQAETVQRVSADPSQPAGQKSSELIEIPGGKPIPKDFKFSKPIDKLTPHERELELQVYYQKKKFHQAEQEAAGVRARPLDEYKDRRREKLIGWFGETVGDWISR
ncbi:hypothetical protein BJX70DRAFT_366940 [Aspergillus crustosus]